ncbi:MAG: hypothetical protein U0R80_10090 [Nocardioidaceae bacterium]
MVELHATDVDGVRCFWVETGRPTLAARLIFRAGMADEWLHESGWMHLLEHLALHGRGGGALAVNGATGLLHTSFDAHGPVDHVAHLLGGLTHWLGQPEFHELEREKSVLAAENALRGSGGAQRALGQRYGSLGPGTAAYPEPGLARATPAGLAHRAQWAFAQGNAVLVLDGPPPPDLRLFLPPGGLKQPARAIPCGDTLPVAYGEEGGLALSGVVTRSVAATFLPDLLQESLHQRLRDGAGAAYAPLATYEAVDDEHALVIATSDLLPTLLPTIADTALRLVKDLASMGPSPEQLRLIKERRWQAMTDPYAASSIAHQAALEYLRSRSPQAHEDLLDELARVSGKEIKEQARVFADTLMIGLPAASRWVGQLPRLEVPHVAPELQGDRHRHQDWPAVSARLVVSEQGLEITDRRSARRVLFEDATAVFGYPGGTRTLVSHDGWSVTLDPAAWHGGAVAVQALDGFTPPQLALSRPATDGQGGYQRRSFGSRWGTWLGRVLKPRAGSTLWQRVMPLAVVVAFAIAVTIVGLPGLPPHWEYWTARIAWAACVGTVFRTIRGERV